MKKFYVTGSSSSVEVAAPDEKTARTIAMEHFYGPVEKWRHVIGTGEYIGFGLSVREIGDV